MIYLCTREIKRYKSQKSNGSYTEKEFKMKRKKMKELEKGNEERYTNLTPPVIKGDKLKLAVISIGSNGDLMFRKERYCLFLKNPDGKSVKVGQMIDIKVVKIFPKVGYVELVRTSFK